MNYILFSLHCCAIKFHFFRLFLSEWNTSTTTNIDTTKAIWYRRHFHIWESIFHCFCFGNEFSPFFSCTVSPIGATFADIFFYFVCRSHLSVPTHSSLRFFSSIIYCFIPRSNVFHYYYLLGFSAFCSLPYLSRFTLFFVSHFDERFCAVDEQVISFAKSFDFVYAKNGFFRLTKTNTKGTWIIHFPFSQSLYANRNLTFRSIY